MKKQLEKTLEGFLEKKQVLKLDVKVHSNQQQVDTVFVDILCLIIRRPKMCICMVSINTGDFNYFMYIHVQSCSISLQQDPEILGGMVVDLGDKFIDMSTKTKVQKIVKALNEGL